VSLSRCTVARGAAEAAPDSTISVARTRVCSAIPGDDDSEAPAAAVSDTETAAEAAADKREVARNPIDSVADTAEAGMAARSWEFDNSADCTATRIPAGAPAGVHWRYNPRLSAKRSRGLIQRLIRSVRFIKFESHRHF